MVAQADDAVGRYIACYYDREAEREWERMDRHRTEFALTQRALSEHLPPPPARILDCGGGPGRYAIELARQGYAVTLFDLSAGNLELAAVKAAAAGVTFEAYRQGTAIDLSCFAGESFDAVLLMGPLYHLLQETQRRQALTEAVRVLKTGGPLFASFIVRYAPLRYAAAEEPDWPILHPDLAASVLDKGIMPPRDEDGSFFAAYMAHPDEVRPLIRSAGLEVRAVLGTEGGVSLIESQINALTGRDWEVWVDLNYRLAKDPTLHGGNEHLLVMAVKPRWRAVLRQITLLLDEAGIPYKVVGGTALALHGIDLPVNDIDIETGVKDAYRVAALFPAQVKQPVTLCNNDLYRSHLGRLDFGGLKVEVMGDLQRREGESWVPTMARTEEQADLDGVPVRVAWLEEETLANIRRGRLERAALCLPHCSRERLLALLHGEK